MNSFSSIARRAIAALLVLVLLSPQSAIAQPHSHSPGEGQGEEKSKEEIKREIARFDYSGDRLYRLGDSDAKVVLVEFADYKCGHCSLFHEITYKKIKSEYIDTGKVLFVAGNFPLQHNRYSQEAAQAAYCAGDQDLYWEMRDRLFRESRYIDPAKITELAEELELDMFQFQGCIAVGTHMERLKREKREAIRLGVQQTPSFILARVSEDGRLDGELFTGSFRWTQMKDKINALLD